jgi:large subunit ribosomal protein L5
MREQYRYANVMQVPRVTKVVVNIGMGEALTDANALDRAAEEVAAITGQKPIINRAKRSIANFRLREGNPIGVSATLRGTRMYEFLDRLIMAALPRIRDFQGLNPNAFDGRGNYSLGIREQLIFPEIDYDKVDKVRGLQVTIVTTAKTDEEGRRLLQLMGMPFQKN